MIVAIGRRNGRQDQSRSPVVTCVPWIALVLPEKNLSSRLPACQRLRSPTCGPSTELIRKKPPAGTRKHEASRGSTSTSPVLLAPARAARYSVKVGRWQAVIRIYDDRLHGTARGGIFGRMSHLLLL